MYVTCYSYKEMLITNELHENSYMLNAGMYDLWREWEAFKKQQWICILLEEHIWLHDYVFKHWDSWCSKIKENNLQHVEINTVSQFRQLNMQDVQQ